MNTNEPLAPEIQAVPTTPSVPVEVPPYLSPESQIGEVQVADATLPAAPVANVAQSTVEIDCTPAAPNVAPQAPVSAPVEIEPSQNAEAVAPAPVVETSDATSQATSASIETTPVATQSPVEFDRTQVETATPVALQNSAPEPALRALFAGAFLGGEWEVKEVLARGATNLYRVSGGDYSAPENKLLAERASIGQTESVQNGAANDQAALQTAPEAAPQAQPQVQANIASQSADDIPPVWDDIALDADNIAALPVSDATNGAGLKSTVLLAPIKAFSQDERDYLLFDWFDSTSLQDWREPTNDTRLLQILAPLAHFLADCAARNEQADVSTETLRVDGAGVLRFAGFTAPAAQNGDANLAALRTISNYLLKHVFAESATMRLDDRFAGLALSDELKELARRLDDDSTDAFSAIGEAAGEIEKLATPVAVLEAALLTDKGRERDHNEDAGMIVRSQRAAMLNSYERELYIVSDGMGGHEGGEVASDLTMTSLVRNLDALQIDWNDNVAVRAALFEVIDAVNAEVVALTETPKYRASRAKPGATLTFALRLGARVFLGNVGDSRAYIGRDGILARATKDHSYVQNLVDRGEITDDEAWEHPEGSIITAHIGYAKLKTRDVFLRLVQPGDKLLIVSDGVVDMLRDRDIAPHLQSASAATIVKNLVDASNAAGGADNITAVCVIF